MTAPSVLSSRNDGRSANNLLEDKDLQAVPARAIALQADPRWVR
jgi:hypothetical protein